MSGDVQPRKRKDKKRKRDALDRKSEGEVSFSRQSSIQDDDEASHGVHLTKMGSDDVHLHVQHEHGTGGHWCAKILFFSLLAVLGGLIALIIMENRGLSDLDTPLSESRFSNYFDGWVEEHRQEHDEHDAVDASIAEHDEHDEPFEEEEEEEDDHSEVDDDDEEEADHEEDDDEEEVGVEKGDDDDDDEEVEATTEQSQEQEDDDDDEDEDEQENATKQDEDDDDDDDDDDEEQTVEETEQNDEKTEENDDDDDNDDDDNEDNHDDVSEAIKPLYNRASTLHARNVASHQQSYAASDADDDDPFDEEDDDGTFESLETVVDNDAEELLLLQEKAREQAAEAAKHAPRSAVDDTDDSAEAAPSWASSLAVKIGVGVALALVARLVLLRKNPNANEEPASEILMKRRLTIATAEDTYPDDEEAPPLPSEDEYSEEEVEIEEEIEYVEEEEEIDIEDIDAAERKIADGKQYVPETFEQLNALYKQYTEPAVGRLATAALQEMSLPATNKQVPAVFNAPPAPPADMPATVPIQTNIAANMAVYSSGSPAETAAETAEFTQGTTVEVTHDLDYQPEDEDIDYDVDDIADGEEVVDEEDDLDDDDDVDDDGDDDDISDVDDADLMNRLEMKYGRLPQTEYESDEDPDDPTWTQIKPKETLGGGPQAHDDVDMFEQELRRANEEMMRENYAAALKAFDLLSRKYPDQPQAFLGKAQALDRLSERERSNKLLSEALLAYKRYLAFDGLIENDAEYRAAAEHCIERMRFLGTPMQALPIHEQLVQRFNNEPSLRNQLAVTLLLLNRLSDAKTVLQEIVRRWPTNGFALVHYGYVLKQHDKDLQNAVIYLQQGIKTKDEGTQDGRFYFNLGDALQRLGRQGEALEVYERGAELQLFPSVYQRSLYNEPQLRAQPFWRKEQTTYALYLTKLEHNWLAIRDEGLSVLSKKGYFLDETESLRHAGDWKQFELYARGQRRHDNCQKAPITCSLIEQFRAASGCRRGQIKFSVMHPGTHVWPHCGPTNCRLRAHLGLVVPTGTRLRVANKESNWTEGKFLIFDDSFEHEVWHNGSSVRLVLIVDVWHPDLSEKQRQTLTPI